MSNPIFRAAFRPGEQIVDEYFYRFHRFLAPTEGETPAQYAGRLSEAGLALHMTAEATRNIQEYKEMLVAAREQNVPLVITTAQIGAPSGGDPSIPDDQAKMDALNAARSATT